MAGLQHIDRSLNATIPTPAAAPMQRTTFGPTTGVTTFRTGRIRVLGGLKPAYIGRKLSPKGNFGTCTEKSDALLIRFFPSKQPHGIEIIVSASIGWRPKIHLIFGSILGRTAPVLIDG